MLRDMAFHATTSAARCLGRLTILLAFGFAVYPAGAEACPDRSSSPCPFDTRTVLGEPDPAELLAPTDIAVAPDKRIYVTQSVGGSDGGRVSVATGEGAFADVARTPLSLSALTVGPDGVVYALSTGGQTLFRFAADGTATGPVTVNADTENRGMDALDVAAAADGTLWLVIRTGSLVHMTADGHRLSDRASGGSWRHIATAPDGDLVLGASSGLEIQHPDGTLVTRFPVSADGALAVLSSGDLVVARRDGYTLVPRDGSPVTDVGSGGDGPGQFRDVGGVVADGSSLLIADTGNHRVQRDALDGSAPVVVSARRRSSLVQPGSAWGQPGGITVVADAGRLVRYDASGALLDSVTAPGIDSRSIGAYNPATGESDVFTWPVARRFAADGQLASSWDLDQMGSYQLPGLAAAADGTIYITDSSTWQHGEIDVFDATGSHLRRIAGPDSGPGDIRDPMGLAIGPAGDLAVAEFRGGINRYSPDGRYLGRVPGLDCNGQAGTALRADAFTIDPAGRVYIEAFGGILIVNPEGRIVGVIGLDNVSVEFNFDQAGNLLLIDSRRARVERLHIDPAALHDMGAWCVDMAAIRPALPSPPALEPSVTVKRTSLRVTGGITRLSLGCTAAAAQTCSGIATITARPAKRRAQGVKPVRLGRSRYVIAGGGRRTVRVRIRRAALQRIGRSRFRARLALTSTSGGETSKTVTVNVAPTPRPKTVTTAR